MGVDIGGTFTDFAMIDEASGGARLEKLLTTPHDPSIAVLQGVETLLAAAQVPVGELASIIHGSTLVTNAVIERKGAPTAMLVTRGFRDVLDIALECRYDLYDLRLRFPEPLVARALRVEIDERMREDGTPLRGTGPRRSRTGRARARETRIRCARLPCVSCTRSRTRSTSGVSPSSSDSDFPSCMCRVPPKSCPIMREYERWTTTAINAFVQPIVDRYLSRIERGLAALGLQGRLSHRDVEWRHGYAQMSRDATPCACSSQDPQPASSWPHITARVLGLRNLLSFDMGGTTAKGAIVRDGDTPQALRPRGRAGARVQGRQRAAGAHPGRRHDRDRRRRGRYRGDRRSGRHPGRTTQRWRRPRPRLLRARRECRHAH